MRPIPSSFLALCLACFLVGAVVLLPGCAPRDVESAAESPTADVNAEPDATDPPATEEVPLYTATYQPSGTEVAVITTAKGSIRIALFFDDAPNTVAAFIERADEGFYDGVTFHRVEPGFVVQGGDPLSRSGDPMVGTGGPGYRLAAEFNDQPHLEGTVAMARTQGNPDSAGSQFYICLAPQPFLDGDYTVFGQVVEGMDVVRSLVVGDVMESVRIERPK